ncbi:TM0106 family RecB-like putative nuclease [Candidatus Woesearchaeota archaeon]|nr:TM0106 family RecB-like putative nuclease [Candidatus Woesearchaeota archaeon]
MVTELQHLIDGKLVPTPTYGAGEWPWQGYTNKKAIELKDISLVSGVKEMRKRKLAAAGITTIEQLASTKLSALTEIGMRSNEAKRMMLSAESLFTEKAIVIKKPELPRAKTELYMDFESTDEPVEADLEKIDYLIGILAWKGQKQEYLPFVAHAPEEEEAMFASFLKFISAQNDFVLYHWHTYERTRMKHLFEKYAVKAALQKHILEHMVDLHKLATDAVIFPTYGNGLKEIAKWLGFSWRHDEVTAQESIAMYLKYAEDNKKYADKLHLILDYNEDDCYATFKIKEYVEGLKA